MPTVLITDNDYPNLDPELAVFAAAGVRVLTAQAKAAAEVIAAGQEADALLAQYAAISAPVFAGLPKCRAVVRYGVGVDNVDLEAARKRGIPVANVPAYGIEEVADHTLALLMAVMRKLPQVQAQVRRGQWQAAPCRPMRSLNAMRLGLVGFGRIGQAVGRRARGFGLRVLAYDPYLPAEAIRSQGAEPVADLQTLLPQSDILSLHLPLSRETRHVIGQQELAALPRGAVVINCSRGGLLNTDALLSALGSGHVAGAGLDVVDGEPIPPAHPLLALEQVIVTSHCAWYTEEAMRRLQTQAAEEVVRALTGQRMLNVVNGL